MKTQKVKDKTKIIHVVPSLELCKRMAELKIFDDCLFWWVYNKLKDEWKVKIGLAECIKTHPESWGYIPAPTVVEMINKLPANIKIGIKTYRPELWKDEDGYGIRYMYFSSKCLMHFMGINLKDEISKMLIYLKENKLI